MVPRKLWLGNHGSAKNPENVVLEPARPTIPTPSTQSFITPTTTVKSGPSIKNLINDPVPAPTATYTVVQPQNPTSTETPTPTTEAQIPATEAPTPQTLTEDIVPQPVTKELTATTPQPETIGTAEPEKPNNDYEGNDTDDELLPHDDDAYDNTEDDELLPHDGTDEPSFREADLLPQEESETPQIVKRPPADPDEDPETFQIFWEAMVEAIFSDMPTLHEPLKHYHPVRKENILIIPVKNDIQENDFAPRKHQVLRYLRDNWDETLDDIEVKLEVGMEVKKYILDDNDKLNALREQNPDIVDFIRSLNLRIKN